MMLQIICLYIYSLFPISPFSIGMIGYFWRTTRIIAITIALIVIVIQVISK
jgi:hypothetical protein